MARNSQDWIDERKNHYVARNKEVDHALRQGKYQQDNIVIERQCAEVDRKLKARVITTSHRSPTGTIKKTQELAPPSAMDKVRAELKKQDIRKELDEKIRRERTARVLKEKEDELSRIEGEEAKRQFAEAVKIKKDRAYLEDMKRRDQLRKETQWEALNKAKNKPQTRATFNDRSQDTERTATIEHKGYKWEYRKKGQAESFTHKDKRGQSLAVIRKLKGHRSFDQDKNAYVDTGKSEDKDQAHTLEEAMEVGADRIKTHSPKPTSLSAAVPEELDRQMAEYQERQEKAQAQSDLQKKDEFLREKEAQNKRAILEKKLEQQYGRAKLVRKMEALNGRLASSTWWERVSGGRQRMQEQYDGMAKTLENIDNQITEKRQDLEEDITRSKDERVLDETKTVDREQNRDTQQRDKKSINRDFNDYSRS